MGSQGERGIHFLGGINGVIQSRGDGRLQPMEGNALRSGCRLGNAFEKLCGFCIAFLPGEGDGLLKRGLCEERRREQYND